MGNAGTKPAKTTSPGHRPRSASSHHRALHRSKIPLVLLILAVCLVILITGLRLLFGRLLFAADRQHIYNPRRKRAFIDTMINGIHVWHFNDYPGQPVVLYCHGTGTNISYYRSMILLTQRLKLNLILFDYHGYGHSTGKSTLSGIIDDARQVYDYTCQHYSADDIIMWGESMGGAPAIVLAGTPAEGQVCQLPQSRCRCLVLLCTFASLVDMSQDGQHHWGIRLLGRSLPYIKFDLPNGSNIRQVTAPIVILHSVEDQLISSRHAQILMDNITHDSKTFVAIRGSHTKPLINSEAMQTVLDWCRISSDVSCDDLLQAIGRWGPPGGSGDSSSSQTSR